MKLSKNQVATIALVIAALLHNRVDPMVSRILFAMVLALWFRASWDL